MVEMHEIKGLQKTGNNGGRYAEFSWREKIKSFSFPWKSSFNLAAASKSVNV